MTRNPNIHNYPDGKKHPYIKYLKVGLSLLVLAVAVCGLWLMLFSTDSIKPVPTKVYPDDSPQSLK